MAAYHVLEYVNQIRADYALPPIEKLLKGRTTNPTQCPVARSIAYQSDLFVIASSDCISVRIGNSFEPSHYYRPPRLVRRWVSWFDMGLHWRYLGRS